MFQPFTAPPKGALVFEQHVHRYPKPISGSQRLSIWYRGLFWETLEPVSASRDDQLLCHRTPCLIL